MEYINDPNFRFARQTALTSGKFDCLHLGHTKLISRVIELGRKHGLATAVFSFHPNPAEFFGREKHPYIFTRNEKIGILNSKAYKGLDFFIEYPFDEVFSQILPDGFINDFLIDRFNCKILVAGEDYRFGRGREGNLDTLKTAGGLRLEVVPSAEMDGGKISASRVRGLIASNDFALAEKIMGRAYFIKGYVKEGKGLGRNLGFPTLNIEIPERKLVPGDGVYVTGCLIEGNEYPSVSNVGQNPTFAETERKCETFILDLDRPLYGKEAEIRFYARIRREIKFPSANALKRQIERDADHAGRWWGLISKKEKESG